MAWLIIFLDLRDDTLGIWCRLTPQFRRVLEVAITQTFGFMRGRVLILQDFLHCNFEQNPRMEIRCSI